MQYRQTTVSCGTKKSEFTQACPPDNYSLAINYNHRQAKPKINSDLTSCVTLKVEVALLVSQSLIVLMVSVDVKQH